MKITKIDESTNRYRRIKRVLFGDDTGKIRTFALLSPENPMGDYADTDYNKKATEELKKALKFFGLTYTPLRGKYDSKENSFVIFNCSLDDAKILTRTYKQKSFFWGKTNPESNSHIGYYKTKNNGETYNLVETSDVITYEDEAEDFFSKFGIKFKINMREFGNDIPEIVDFDEFEESLREERTPKSRAMHRRDAYRK